MEINLISDTVTKPSHEMLQAMFNAQVGDDVYKQDPTVIQLESKVAAFFDMDAALFFPSGTMANQTAIKLHTQPGEQLIADKWAHVFNYEGGGVAFNSGVSCALINGDRGMITAQQVANTINDPNFYHSPLSSLVCLENTTNKGGGACYDFEEFKKIKAVCDKNHLKLHLDGARIWNALVATQNDPKHYGKVFDTISVCLSKGLGAPIGSLLISDNATINKALRIRKIFGGGMRQVGYLAAAGIYALDHNINRLEEDHRRAKEIGIVLANKNWISKIEKIETNILIFSVNNQIDEKIILDKFHQKGILISSMGHGKLRMVTHLDYREVMHSYVLETVEKMNLSF